MLMSGITVYLPENQTTRLCRIEEAQSRCILPGY